MELVNTIDSKELYANRAVNDKNGNPIDTTYMDSNKLTIEGGKITKYDGTPFAGQGGGSGGNTVITSDDNSVTITETTVGDTTTYDLSVEAVGPGGSVSTDDTLNGDGTETNPLGVDIDKISDELHYPTETSNFVVDEPLRMYVDDEGTVHIADGGSVSTDDTLNGDGTETNPLGVNVPYMKWLMGVDTKDLWTGSLTALNTEITLNDDITNYDKIEFWFGGGNDVKLIVTIIPAANERVCFVQGGGISATHISWITGIFAGRVFKFTAGRDYNYGSTTTWATPTITSGLYTGNFQLTMIKGIHRKEWNGGN